MQRLQTVNDIVSLQSLQQTRRIGLQLFSTWNFYCTISKYG